MQNRIGELSKSRFAFSEVYGKLNYSWIISATITSGWECGLVEKMNQAGFQPVDQQ